MRRLWWFVMWGALAMVALSVVGCTASMSREEVTQLIDARMQESRDALLEGKDLKKYDNSPRNFEAKGYAVSELIESIGWIQPQYVASGGGLVQRGGSTTPVTDEYVFVTLNSIPSEIEMAQLREKNGFSLMLVPLRRHASLKVYSPTPSAGSEKLSLDSIRRLPEFQLAAVKRPDHNLATPLFTRSFPLGDASALEIGDFVYAVGDFIVVPAFNASRAPQNIGHMPCEIRGNYRHEGGVPFLVIGCMNATGRGDAVFALRDGAPELIGITIETYEGNQAKVIPVAYLLELLRTP